MDIKSRFKNPYFLFGLGAVILSAMGINIEMLTSWSLFAEAFAELVQNPAMIISVIVAIIGVFVDPSTPKFKDKSK